MANAISQATATVPSEDSALSFGDAVNDITHLLSGSDDPALNPGGKKRQQGDEGDEEDQSDDASDEDQLVVEGEEEVEQEDGETDEPDGEEEPEIKGGQFAPLSAKVTLEDGTILTVADLVRNNLYQRDYTRKTTELAEERKQFDTDKAFVGQHAQAVAQQRQVMAQYLQMYLPQPPDAQLARDDPYKYQIARAEYEQKAGHLSAIIEQIRSAEKQQQDVREQELVKIREEQARKFFEKRPAYRDQQKFGTWFQEAARMMIEDYEFTPDEVSKASDSRFYVIMDQLLRLKKAEGRKPQVQKQMQGKPRLLTGSVRNGAPVPSIMKERRVHGERLRKTGSMDAAVAKLGTFDL